jgi:DNA-binding MarR family transcriptional regulator
VPNKSNITKSPLLLVYSSIRILFQQYDELLEPFDLTYTQYLALLCIEQKQVCSINDIGEMLALDSGTLSPLIKKLELRGLVKRQRSYEDERKLRISLTDKGSALMSQTHQVHYTVLQNLSITEDDMQVLESILGTLQNLKKLKRKIKEPKPNNSYKISSSPLA